MKRLFRPGIITLLGAHKRWIKNRRIGLVSHSAAVDSKGKSSADLLMSSPETCLVALFAPEHGFFGTAPAGKVMKQQKHPSLHIPLYSLYGRHKSPTTHMLDGLDGIVFDLQDIGARPYTYVTTLRLTLEAAAEHGKTLIVADRPIPLPSVTDGPLLDSRFESFVSAIQAPMCYGMTPGETALWLKHFLNLDIDLRIAEMKNYRRQPAREPDWPPWIPPSPGIRTWESGYCFAATVFTEALPAIDNGRGTGLDFQLFGARWMKSQEVCEMLGDLKLRGVRFHPHHYVTGSGRKKGERLDGIRITVTHPDTFRPVTTAISIIYCIQELYGRERIWQSTDVRPAFFDQLFGTDTVRKALMDRERPEIIAGSWRRDLSAFRKSRRKCLLYGVGER